MNPPPESMKRFLPAAAGVTFAALYGVALVVVPPLPGVDKPGGEVVAHLNEYASAMRLQALLV